MKKLTVAIDGYSGTGKSSTAKEVAKALNYRYIDSGAMYRAITFLLISRNIAYEATGQIEDLISEITMEFRVDEKRNSWLFVNGSLLDNELRSVQVNEAVSVISAIPVVRKKLVEKQRQFGEDKSVVMDGRDIGTVVFPDAELKVFMTADVDVRAQRRFLELDQKGITASLDEIRENLLARDSKDTNRKDSPLVKAEDAIVVDTTILSFNDQVRVIVDLANKLIHEN